MRSLVSPATAVSGATPQAWRRSVQMPPVAPVVLRAPPRFFEYVYYVLMLYSAYGPVLGLHIRFFVPGLLALLVLVCGASMGPKRLTALAPIAFALACGVSFLAIQLAWHGESLLPQGNADKPEGQLGFHLAWLMMLVVLQALLLRPGFLHRFALVNFVSGAGLLQYLKFHQYSDTVVRLGLEGVGRDNPNHLGMWGGFCAVYFFVLGIETPRMVVRVTSWIIGVGCLFIVSLTVSRGPLFAATLAVTIALRRVLKRGFISILFLLAMGGILYESGLFDQVTSYYLSRGLEESGRGLTLPVAIERFISAPLLGSGVSHLLLEVEGADQPITPHNGILHLALAGGIVPALLFVAYWLRAALGTLKAQTHQLPDAPYLLPLWVFAFLEMMIIDYAFMSDWHVVVLGAGVTAYAFRQAAEPSVATPRLGGRR